MKPANSLLCTAAALLFSTAAFAAPVREEHVTNGALDLVWNPGFGVTANMQPATLSPGHPAYANPSGDHTVAVATTMQPDSGGIVLTATDPGGYANYDWEGWIFTGDGNSRRGLVVRADPSNLFQSCYQFVVQSGLFQLNFRKLIAGAPTNLATWFASSLPAGSIAPNTWHTMKVTADGNTFRCFFDGFELNGATPIVDSDLPAGWRGVYNFRFDIGNIPFYTDDLLLTPVGATAAQASTWGRVKALYSK